MKRVLIVDDDAQLRQGLVPLFARAGFAAAAFASGADAVAAHRADPADLALLDLFMPDMDGLETLQQLRAFDPHFPIIMVSGGGAYHDCRLLKAAQKMGATAVLTKPFTSDELFQTLHDASAHSGREF